MHFAIKGGHLGFAVIHCSFKSYIQATLIKISYHSIKISHLSISGPLKNLPPAKITWSDQYPNGILHWVWKCQRTPSPAQLCNPYKRTLWPFECTLWPFVCTFWSFVCNFWLIWMYLLTCWFWMPTWTSTWPLFTRRSWRLRILMGRLCIHFLNKSPGISKKRHLYIDFF